MVRSREPGFEAVTTFRLAVVLAAGLAFWLPGLVRTGAWPAPLDDVYIYFGFARSTALGHPLSWVPGNGFSSGATSLLYPLVLAPLWAVGLRGPWLGLGAALVAALSLVDLAGSLARLSGPRGRERHLAWLAPLVVVAVPLLDWSLFSGMETALFAGLLGRALVAVHAAHGARPARRARSQWRAGLWLALLPLARPESLTVAACLAVAVAHGAGALPTLPSLARAGGPAAATLGLQLVANRALTGEWQAAGAIRKLLTEEPHTAPADVAVAVGTNLVVLAHQGLYRALGGPRGLVPLGLLVAAALLVPGRRRLAAALVVGAFGALALVCLNGTARYQNYRYVAPTLLALLVVAHLGAVALSRRGKTARALGLALAAALIVAPIGEWARQRDHFARASRNVMQQQGEVARRLAHLEPRPTRVLVGDAGAIPYLSGLPALDGLGLGGYRDLPFARASLHGDAAVVELIERMPPADRPDVMALYPAWWGRLTERFGERLDAVRIDDNVICAADEKVIYRSDWSDLAEPSGASWPGLVDRLDVADLVEERAHGVAFARETGHVVDATRLDAEGRSRWDAGRTIDRGHTLRFRVSTSTKPGASLLVRTDAAPTLRDQPMISVIHANGATTRAPLVADRCDAPERWCDRLAEVALRPGDEVSLDAAGDDLRVFHVAVLEAPPR